VDSLQRPQVVGGDRLGHDDHRVDVAVRRLPRAQHGRADDVQLLDEAGQGGVDEIEVGTGEGVNLGRKCRGVIHACSLS